MANKPMTLNFAEYHRRFEKAFMKAQGPLTREQQEWVNAGLLQPVGTKGNKRKAL